MRIRCILTAVLLITFALSPASPVVGQAPPPPPNPHTLWSFLGIPQAYYKVRNASVNRRGNRPGMEAKPPLKGIADPRNLESPYEPIKVAAEVKQAEDAAPQKIKGIKYLAQVGCGCYDKDGNKVTKAMIAGLNDCTEDVRLATVEAIAEAAAGNACPACSQRSCCNEDITLQLAKLAYERDEHGCYLEPSEEVRQAAQRALSICCPNPIPVEVIEEEGGPGRTRESGEPTPAQPDDATTLPDEPVPHEPGDVTDARSINTMQVSSRRTWKGQKPSGLIDVVVSESPEGVSLAPITGSADQQVDASEPRFVIDRETVQNVRGAVERVDVNRGFAFVQVGGSADVPAGTKLNIYHEYLLGEKHVATVEVVHASKGLLTVRAVNRAPLDNVARGDRVSTR